MDKPLVSAVIASYNHEKYIEEAVMGIVNQTYENIQIIVIDDKSTDSTFEKIIGLGKKHHFIYEQRDKNQGHCSINFNYAVNKYVKGKYLAVCASDDVWFPEKIEKQVHFMEENPQFAMCYTNSLVCDSEGNFIGFGGSGPCKNFESIIMLRVSVPASSKFYRTNIFVSLGGYNEDILIEDWDFILRCSEKHEICYLNEALVKIIKHDSNMSDRLYSMHEAQHKIIDKWASNKIYIKAKKRLYYNQFIVLLYRGDDKGFSLICKSGMYIFNINTIYAILRYFFVRFICKVGWFKSLSGGW